MEEAMNGWNHIRNFIRVFEGITVTPNDLPSLKELKTVVEIQRNRALPGGDCPQFIGFVETFNQVLEAIQNKINELEKEL